MSTAAPPVRPDAPAAPRRDMTLLWHQIKYEQLTFWRNPQSAFFTFVFPIVIIAIFGALFRGGKASPFYDGLTPLQYYVATIAALSVLSACYSQLAIVLSTRRQDGILKRVRATPLPTWMYFMGLLAHCVMVSVVDIALVIGIGNLYGVPLPEASQLPAITVTLILGAASFCAIGVGVASLIRNAEAAPAVVQFILFPLVFVSGTYIPIQADWLNLAAGALPVKPFNEALLGSISGDAAFPWQSLGVLALWGALGAVVAIRRFRWDPKPE